MTILFRVLNLIYMLLYDLKQLVHGVKPLQNVLILPGRVGLNISSANEVVANKDITIRY